MKKETFENKENKGTIEGQNEKVSSLKSQKQHQKKIQFSQESEDVKKES